jgi:hypothetical protein
MLQQPATGRRRFVCVFFKVILGIVKLLKGRLRIERQVFIEGREILDVGQSGRKIIFFTDFRQLVNKQGKPFPVIFSLKEQPCGIL